jgi:hypothetical protein
MSDLTTQKLEASFVPTPTREYLTTRARDEIVARVVSKEAIKLPTPSIPKLPLFFGARALIYKQDPSVGEIGIRKVYLPGYVATGPRDSRIEIQGAGPATHNQLGDFIESPGTSAFDAVHTFAVVRQTLTMYQRAMNAAPLPWQWNSSSNTAPIQVLPRAGVTMNAYYSRSQKSIKFFYFDPPGTTPGSRTTYTCRSLDIVAHETGHAILDGLKPNWLLANNPPQTGGLHESFGDLTAMFLVLSQLDQVEAVIAQTKSNLHDKSFLSDLAEEFGNALGRTNGLRNADNDLRLSEVGTEVHAISQVFTGAIYDILADIFALERNPALRDDAAVLAQVSNYVMSLVLRAIIMAPNQAATYAHVANRMLQIAQADRKPAQYRNFIRNRFAVREVVVAATPFAADTTAAMAPMIHGSEDADQDRSHTCGTMRLAEYSTEERILSEETERFKQAMLAMEKDGPEALIGFGDAAVAANSKPTKKPRKK